MLPVESSAQVCASPVETAAALVMPLTVTGVVRSVRVPSPRRPLPLYPQHWTLPVESRAHV